MLYRRALFVEGTKKIDQKKMHEYAKKILKKEKIPFYEIDFGKDEEDEKGEEAQDCLFREAKRIVIENGEISHSLIQRELNVSYARAEELIQLLEEKEIIEPRDSEKEEGKNYQGKPKAADGIFHDRTPLFAFVGGFDHPDSTALFNFRPDPHSLISGKPGSGAGEFFNALILEILRFTDPLQLQVALLDSGGICPDYFSRIGNLLSKPAKTKKDCRQELANIRRELEERHDLLDKAGAKNNVEYNALNRGRMPDRFVFVSKLEDFEAGEGGGLDEMKKIAQFGKKAGIFLAVRTQKRISEIADPKLLVGFQNKFMFAPVSKKDLKVLPDKPEKIEFKEKLKKGEAYNLEKGSKPYKFHPARLDKMKPENIKIILQNTRQ